MNKTGIFSIGFGIGIIGIILLYFFWFVPEIEKAKQSGRDEITSNTDTVYVKGKDSLVADTLFVESKSKAEIKNDLITASLDTTIVRDRDSVDAKLKVSIKDSTANWLVDVKFRKYERVDTVKQFIPKIINTVEMENNWLLNLISYVSGVLTAVLIFIIQ